MSSIIGNNITLEDLFIEGSLFLHGKNNVARNDRKIACIVIREGKEEIVANDPGDWFEFLKRDGCRELMIQPRTKETDTWDEANQYGAARKKAAFLGLQGSYLAAVYDGHIEYWIFDNREKENWSESKDFPSDRYEDIIWSLKQGVKMEKQTIDLDRSVKELGAALRELLSIAKRLGYPSFVNDLEKAIAYLENGAGSPPIDPAIGRLVEQNVLSSTAQHILGAIAIADGIYGGMGSWSDTAAQGDEKEKQRVADEAYLSLSEVAYADAFNSAKWV